MTFTIGKAKSAAREGIAEAETTDRVLDNKARETSLVVIDETPKSGQRRAERLVDDDFPFDDSQIAAMEGMVASNYACLTGAAGTGKTTTTKGFVDRLLDTNHMTDVNLTNYWKADSVPADEDDDYVLDESHATVPGIAMCAYTGRASQQIKKNFPPGWHNNIMTIHRLLAFVPEYFEDWDDESQDYKTKMRFVPTYNANLLLPWDVIIVDEAGMLGLDLWDQLYAAMKPGCRLYFIGDINQLPPIYGKSVFGFAMARWPTFELAKVHRQAGKNNPIVDNAWRVIHGIRPETEGKFKMMEIPVDSLKASSIVRGVSRKLHQLGVYKPLRDAVITPIHGINPGPGSSLGDYPLNEHYSHMFNDESGHPRYVIDGGREKKLFAVGDKVMATKNDWASGITNGMTGHITEIIPNEGYNGARIHYGLLSEVNARFAKGGHASLPIGDMEDLDLDDLDSMAADIAADKGVKKEKESRDRGPSSHTVIVRFGEGDSAFDKPFESLAEVGTLQLAYVVTCHKMQGGEAPTIIIILHETHSRSLSREWLYTAITRASENCILLYTDRGLRIALNRQAIPGSTLREKILAFQKIMDPKGDGKNLGIRLPHDPNNTLPTILEQDSVRDLADRETEKRLNAGGPVGGLASLIAKQKAKADEANRNENIDQVIRTETVHTIKIKVTEERVVPKAPPPPPPMIEPEIVDGGTLDSLVGRQFIGKVKTIGDRPPRLVELVPAPLLLTHRPHNPRYLPVVSQPFHGASPEQLELERRVAAHRVPPPTPKPERPALTLGQLFARSKRD